MTFISTQSNSLTRTTINSIQKNGQKAQKSIEKLSTGKHLNRAGDDVASSSISTKLTSKLRGITKAQGNIMDAMGHLDVAESGLTDAMDIIQNIRDLMVKGLNGTNSVDEKNILQEQLNAYVDSLADMRDTLEVNMYVPPGIDDFFGFYDNILSNGWGFSTDNMGSNINIGLDYQFGEEDGDTRNIKFGGPLGNPLNLDDYLGVNPANNGLTNPFPFTNPPPPGLTRNRLIEYTIPGSTIGSVFDGGPPYDTDDLEVLNNSVRHLSRMMSTVNAKRTFFQNHFDFLEEKKLGYTNMRSQLEDTDFATESTKFAKAQIKQQTASSMLSQSNAQSQLALSLLP
ncbi:MAG: flagellin [Candidatus Caenarcaniphilales bacterium]|nr:flagellin [Candidatus Caenarcaniphilales bacterium]